jgi:hypothetical protein
MDDKPDSTPEQFLCHAKRHMGAEFVLYDTMFAMAKAGWNRAKKNGTWPDGREWRETDPLICYAKRYNLANAINRTSSTVTNMAEALEKDGWIIPTHSGQRRRQGEWASNEFLIITHADYERAHDTCPALRYNPDTGQPFQRGDLNAALGRYNVKQLAGLEEMPDWMAEVVRQVMAGRKATVSRNLDTDGVQKAGEPCLETQPRAVSRNLVTSLKSEAGKKAGTNKP